MLRRKQKVEVAKRSHLSNAAILARADRTRLDVVEALWALPAVDPKRS